MAVVRFGVSLELELLSALDTFVQDNSYANRSQAIRALIEKNVVEKKWMCNSHVAGAIILIYDPEKNDVASHLLEAEQLHAHLILSTQRFFRANKLCLEVIALDGIAQDLTCFADSILSLKGIIHGKLLMSRVE